MNRIKIIVLTVILLVMSSCSPTYAGQLAPNHYYTWAIPEPNVPDGSIITSVDVNLAGIDGQVHVWLCDNPPIGWIKNIGTMQRDTYLGQVNGEPDLEIFNYTLSLSSVILGKSWTYNIFPQPFTMDIPAEDGGTELIMMNAALLEYIDYAGNSTPSGLLLYGDCSIDSISVVITIRSYTGEYYRDVQSYSVTVPKDLEAIEKWADSERLKLMHEYYEKMQELEIRIEMEMED